MMALAGKPWIGFAAALLVVSMVGARAEPAQAPVNTIREVVERLRSCWKDRSRRQRTLQREKFPGMFPGVRRSAELGQVLGHYARYQRSAILEVVRGRQDQRLVQLRGPASRQVQEQSGDHLCSGTGNRGARIPHLPRTLCTSE